MTNVSVDFIAGRDSVTPALRKMQEQVDRLTQKNQRLADASKKSGRAGADNLQRMADNAAVAAVAYVALTKTIGLANKEIDRQNKLQAESRSTQLNLATAQSQLVKNIGNVSQKQLDRFQGQLAEIARNAELASVAPVTAAAASVLSAVGGDRSKTLAILSQAAPFFRQDPEGLAEFGGAIGDVSKATGLDAEKSLGFALAIQGQARFTTLGGLTAVAPALQSARVARFEGVDPTTQAKQAAALFAGIGGQIADPSGELTKTATSNLIANLARFAPGGTLFEQIERVQQDPKLQAEVLKSGFRGAIKPVIQELVAGTGGLTFAAVEAAFPKLGVAPGDVERRAALLRGGTAPLALATTEQGIAGIFEEFELEQTLEAKASQARAAFRKLSGKSEDVLSGTVRLFGQDIANLFSGPEGDRARFINQIEQIRERQFEDFGAIGEQKLEDLPADRRRLVQLADDLLNELRGIRQNQQGVNPSSVIDE